jgi:hypothetical protein
MKERISLRKRINEFCKGCIYDKNGDGAWREQVTACTSYRCPLYDVRPLQYTGRKATKTTETATI